MIAIATSYTHIKVTLNPEQYIAARNHQSQCNHAFNEIIAPFVRTDTYLHSFFPRMIPQWNDLQIKNLQELAKP